MEEEILILTKNSNSVIILSMIDNLYFLQLTVYQYNKKKIKMDYSCIPVKLKSFENPITLFSEVSDEKIDVSKAKFRAKNDIICSKSEKQKEGKAIKTYIVVQSLNGLEDEEKLKKELLKIFKRHWFYKIKYMNFINKKINMRQL